MTIFVLVLLAGIIFEYINGFNDAANSIATVVSTKVMTPRTAIMMAAICDLIGAFLGTAVAKTVGSGTVDVHAVTMTTVLGALVGAITWNLITWSLGLPSSSSHALIGGLCGGALATTHGDWSVLIWDHAGKGLWPQIVVPMIVSPIAGFTGGFVMMMLLTIAFVNVRPRIVGAIFGKAQIGSAILMGINHGRNDAQKTMGVITLALFTGTSSGAFDSLPNWLSFLHTPKFEIRQWVIFLCAITMAAGTATGGWRIIRTMGHKMVRLQPVHGFAAETTAGIIIQIASTLGIPISTTHTIATSIMGVGAMKRFSAVKWGIVQNIVWAWVLTIPATAFIGWLAVNALHLIGW
jgi:PiT family inorganic phosphate transporter